VVTLGGRRPANVYVLPAFGQCDYAGLGIAWRCDRVAACRHTNVTSIRAGATGRTT
jgi:hypothetical protein